MRWPALTDAAHAQKRDKRRVKKGEAKPQYSSEFVAAYQPANEAVMAEGAGYQALKPQLASLATLAASTDEQAAAGQLILNAGIKSKDSALQFQGVEMVLASGKLHPKKWAATISSPTRLGGGAGNLKGLWQRQRPISSARSTVASPWRGVSTSDLKLNMAELYFSQDQYQRGLDYLLETIEARKAAGETIEEAWYRRGIAFGYNNEIVPQV